MIVNPKGQADFKVESFKRVQILNIGFDESKPDLPWNGYVLEL